MNRYALAALLLLVTSERGPTQELLLAAATLETIAGAVPAVFVSSTFSGAAWNSPTIVWRSAKSASTASSCAGGGVGGCE